MRPALALSLIGLSILSPGCALVEDSSRNFMVAVCSPIETHRELARNRTWAENAWAKTCASSGPRGFSGDFAQGFKDGYAEYLYRGGEGEPPLLAPKYYRHLKYQTPEGYLAVEDWFAGYRHGAAGARDTGARRWITGPTGWLPEPPGPTGHVAPRPSELPDTLPMPQPVPKVTFEQRAPDGVAPSTDETKEKVTVINAPPPEPPPLKATIKGVIVPAEPKATIRGVIVPVDPKATIRGITVPPTEEPETAVEATRTPSRTVTRGLPKD